MAFEEAIVAVGEIAIVAAVLVGVVMAIFAAIAKAIRGQTRTIKVQPLRGNPVRVNKVKS